VRKVVCEMKMRNTHKQGRESVALPKTAPDRCPEVLALKKRISELQGQVVALQAENSRLREQKTIAVQRCEQPQSSGDSGREQQHKFFKYSNARTLLDVLFASRRPNRQPRRATRNLDCSVFGPG